MDSIVDWGRLVAQGRVKAIGIRWTKEEEIARSEGVSAEDIRTGVWKPSTKKQESTLATIVTCSSCGPKKEVEVKVGTVKEKGVEEVEINKPIKTMRRDELIDLGKKLELEFDENVVTRGDLIQLIESVTG